MEKVMVKAWESAYRVSLERVVSAVQAEAGRQMRKKGSHLSTLWLWKRWVSASQGQCQLELKNGGGRAKGT